MCSWKVIYSMKCVVERISKSQKQNVAKPYSQADWSEP